MRPEGPKKNSFGDPSPPPRLSQDLDDKTHPSPPPPPSYITLPEGLGSAHIKKWYFVKKPGKIGFTLLVITIGAY